MAGTNSTPIEYVFQLPAIKILELSTLLDTGGYWEEVALAMPAISDIDIDACRRLKTGERPTEALLRIWGSKGYKILDLYKVFFRLKLLRCMHILLEYIDEKYHKFSKSSLKASPLNAAEASRSQQPISNETPVYSSSKKRSEQVPNSEISPSKAVSSSAPYIKDSADSELANGLQNTLSVAYAEIVEATENFSPSNMVGKGGYGEVYKGVWKHMDVAVKRIRGKQKHPDNEKDSRERILQTLQELQTLGKYRHDNILSLYGYSMHGPEPCLIYQFMPNGSLEDLLLCRKRSEPLDWSTRFKICRGVARALHFLHSAVGNVPIIHGDVKSANILLDKHMEPKLGDFGLSRMGRLERDSKQNEDGLDQKPMIASHIKGTFAYLPPEFISQRILTTKLDVYSYGIVLLEVATGQRAYVVSRRPPELLEFVTISLGLSQLKLAEVFSDSACSNSNFICIGRDLATVENLADKRVPLNVPKSGDNDDDAEAHNAFCHLLNIGLKCAQRNRFSRPTFADVISSFSLLTKN